jgi:hypothetical protein
VASGSSYLATAAPTANSTKSPALEPTHLPTSHPCDGGSHDCDSISTCCSKTESDYTCSCLGGFLARSIHADGERLLQDEGIDEPVGAGVGSCGSVGIEGSVGSYGSVAATPSSERATSHMATYAPTPEPIAHSRAH